MNVLDSPVEQEASAPPAGSAWGSLPLVALIVSIGLLVIAVAFSNARLAAPDADLLYWAGFLLIVIPIALVVLRPDRTRSERVGLVILLGLATYVAKVLHSPSYFTLLDEFLHVRTAQDIIDTGRLFLPNPLLVVSPLYPGLELVTSGVAQLTGLATFDVGVAIVGFARLLLMLSLFAVFEEASGSARVASIAAVIYGSNPNFGLFDSQFAYESLALPLAVASIYAVVRWQRAEVHRRRYLVLALVAISGVVVTHHLTSIVLIAFLAIWMIVAAVVGPRRAWLQPAVAFLFAATAAVIWVLTIASETIRYLAPRVRDSLELFRLIIGQSTQRGIFETTTGYVTPDWERFIALGVDGHPPAPAADRDPPRVADAPAGVSRCRARARIPGIPGEPCPAPDAPRSRGIDEDAGVHLPGRRVRGCHGDRRPVHRIRGTAPGTRFAGRLPGTIGFRGPGPTTVAGSRGGRRLHRRDRHRAPPLGTHPGAVPAGGRYALGRAARTHGGPVDG